MTTIPIKYEDKVKMLNYLDENNIELTYLSDLAEQLHGFFPQYSEIDIASLVMQWRTIQEGFRDKEILLWYAQKHLLNGIQKLQIINKGKDNEETKT